MKWSGEQYKCRNCGEVYPYSLSKCSCGGICDKIADASQGSPRRLNSNHSVLAEILEAEKQKEQDEYENQLARLYDAVKDACSKNKYPVAILHLKQILKLTPDSKDAQDLLNFCKRKAEQSGQNLIKDVTAEENIQELFNRGRNYFNGFGVAQSYTQAVKWYRKAADQGHAEAQYNLGYCYYNGKGVAQSYTEAVKWFYKAAEQGHAEAQYNLGFCYYSGRGVAQSYSEAIKWFHLAADQGDAGARTWLGICYKRL